METKDEKINWATKIIIAIIFVALWPLLASLGSRTEERYKQRRSKKYRKVIKEGLLWDSVEWHERE